MMKAKTKLLLYHLLWTAGSLSRPTFRNLSQSFEGWAYRNGLLPEVRRLERLGVIESRFGALDRRRLVRLTDSGRLLAWGGRDPEMMWAKDWDHKWRLVMFDLPKDQPALRKRVTRALHQHGFGGLQGSVWVSPHPPFGSILANQETGNDCSHFLVLVAESEGETCDRKIVQASWDFAKINKIYEQHMDVIRALNSRVLSNRSALLRWSEQENRSWLQAVGVDPLLPTKLLPSGYLGKKAFHLRKKAISRAVKAVAAWA
jgi:phenylacetic acid degradation operon negative regulatory protein